jgi:hypothetical protein
VVQPEYRYYGVNGRKICEEFVMKRFLTGMSVLIIILLAACSTRATPQVVTMEPTLSADELQTQIAQMLTQLPTEAGAVDSAPTMELPTVQVEAPAEGYPVEGVFTATAQPTITNTPEPVPPTPTETPVPPTPTATVEATAEATALPAATQPAGPTSTPPPNDPRIWLGPPTSTDPMDNDTTWIWPTGSDQFTRGTFGSGMQTITALGEKDGWRMANPLGRQFTNLYLEGTFRTNTCTGSDRYGLMVRVPNLHEPEQGYLFGVTCDGRYSLRRWNAEVGPRGEMKVLVNWTASKAINTGSNQTNRIGIFTMNHRLIMYANGQLLGEVQDTQFTSGNFGVFLGSTVTTNYTIQVEEMSYWENPPYPQP